MRISRALIAAAVLLAAAAPHYAVAQVEATPIPSQMKPDFAPVSFLLGTWKCSTKSSRRPMAYATTSTYALDSTGYWINETTVTNHVAWIMHPLQTWDRITYDSDSKRWVDLSYDSQGGYTLSYSKGWNGNQISWHDSAFAPGPDISAQADTIVTKVSPTKTTLASSFTETKSGRKITVSGICTKA